MNTKEKAKELIDKYFDLVEAQTAEQQEDNARKAALIAVKEMKIEFIKIYDYERASYWKLVEHEINKL